MRRYSDPVVLGENGGTLKSPKRGRGPSVSPTRTERSSQKSGTTPAASHSPDVSPLSAVRRSLQARSGDSASPSKGEASNVRVLVRVRPFSATEVESAQQNTSHVRSVVDAARSDQVQLLDHTHDYDVKFAFCFDNVFWSVTQQKSPTGFATQRTVYEETGAMALDSAWEGMNSCIFAYGQTGSGKTHTMMGDPSKIGIHQGQEGALSDDEQGVIPRLCRHLFEDIEERKKHSIRSGIQKMFKVEVQFVEIYNEKVRDLLSTADICNSFIRTLHGTRDRDSAATDGKLTSPLHAQKGAHGARQSGAGTDFTQETHPLIDPLDIGSKEQDQNLRVREHPTEGPILEGCTAHEPTTFKEIIQLITHGNSERSTAQTKMNDRSSRSHAIFRVSLHQVTSFDVDRVGIGRPMQRSSERRANINLVDLAGSENVKRSGASGATMREAQNINQSLTCLRRVIDKLIERRAERVPYRDSTLTWLLRTDLGGNSKCVMLATVSPHYLNAYETQRTLTYAMRARSIVNTVRVNEDDTAAMLSDLEKRMREAQQRMDHEGISGEERDKLLQDMEATRTAHGELEARIHEMQEQASRFQEEVDTVRRERAAETLKNCVMLQIAKRRQAKAKSAAASVAEMVDAWKGVLRREGHEDVDSLATSLERTHARVKELEAERQRISAQSEGIARSTEDRLDVLARENESLAGLEREKAEEAMAELRDLQSDYERLRATLETIESDFEVDKARMADDHETVERAMLLEMENKGEEFGKEKERWIRDMGDLEESCQRSVRQADEQAQKRIRILQDAESTLRIELQESKKEWAAQESQIEALKKELSSHRASEETAREERLREYSAKSSSAFDELRGEHTVLRDRAAFAQAVALRRSNQKAAMQMYYERMEQKSGEYQRQFDAVSEYMRYLRSDELPVEWTMQDAAEMLSALQRFQREYAGNRPNAETIKQVLREEPDRTALAGYSAQDRERIIAKSPQRPTLSDTAAGSLCHALFDGITCPDLPTPFRRGRGRSRSPGSRLRSSSAHSDVSTCYSEADKVPYVSEGWQDGGQGHVRHTTFVSPAAARPAHPSRRGRSLGRSASPNRKTRRPGSLSPHRPPVQAPGSASRRRQPVRHSAGRR